jgi:hypothetical protein
MEALQDPFTWIYVLTGGVILLFILVIFLFVRVLFLKKRIKKFFSGTKVENLEAVFTQQVERSQQIEKNIEELTLFAQKIYTLFEKSPYKVGLVRFNPFHDVGGNQSFALALLDKKKTGVVLSSLFTRGGTRIYAKPVQHGASLPGFEFSDEETKAIHIASSQKIKNFIKEEDSQ